MAEKLQAVLLWQWTTEILSAKKEKINSTILKITVKKRRRERKLREEEMGFSRSLFDDQSRQQNYTANNSKWLILKFVFFFSNP